MVATVLLATLVACEYPNDAVVVENESSVVVHLVSETDNTRLELDTLQPGQLWQTRLECTGVDLVVESEDGEELARRPGPFCQGEDPWVITDELLQGG